jgi:AMP-polyphosphate phosphotransferase
MGWPALDKMKMLVGSIDDETYARRLKELQYRLLNLQIHHMHRGGRAIICIDGWDAAGKGGLIKRAVAELEPRSTHVWRIGAPTADEQGRHYLWRFWQRLPAPGNWAFFDRTWYGRVLVERIEGFCDKAAWKRAYREINEFERQLTDDGVRIVKLLIHVSADEQRQRMIDRLEKPYKHYKVGLEDFRNIARRDDYLEAYGDMLDKTDTDNAPWHVIASDSKKLARLSGLSVIANTIGHDIETTEQVLDPVIAEAAGRLWGWKPGGSKKNSGGKK